MLKSLWQAINHSNSITWVPPTARLFSASRVNQILTKDPEARRKALDNDKEAKRSRYLTDEAFRQKLRLRTKAWYIEHRETALGHSRSTSWQKYREDAQFRHRVLERSHVHYQVYRQNPCFTLARNMYKWIARHHEWLVDLPWKSHRPFFSPKAVEHFCEGCRYVRHGGGKVWWISKDDPDKYTCNSCYVQDVDQALPTGYEGVRTFKDLVARKKELDNLEKKEPAP